MTAQDFLINETLRSVDAFFDAIKRVPADKLEWSPLDNGRSVLNQAQECAQSAMWGVSVVRAGKFDWDAEKLAKAKEERESWTTLDQCEAKCRENTEALVKLIRETREEDLEKTISIPFGKTHDWKIVDILNLHAWNLHYHTGQVNYIQTLYGDKTMA